MHFQTNKLAISSLVLLGITSSASAFTICKNAIDLSNGPSLLHTKYISRTCHNSKLSFRNSNTKLRATDEAESTEKKDEGGASMDILNSPAFLKRKLEVVKADIVKVEEDIENAQKALEAGKALWGDKLEAIQKERSVLQSRMLTQSKTADLDATVEVVGNLLSVVDNFERAFNTVTPETESDKVAEEAYKKAYNHILETFEKLGVKVIETIGKEFDYELHNAVMMRPSEDYDEGIVIEEFAKGFVYGEIGQDEEGNSLGGKLIRPAMVIVSA